MCIVVRVSWGMWESVGDFVGKWARVRGREEVGSLLERTSQEEPGGNGQSRGGQYGKETTIVWRTAARHPVFHQLRRRPTRLF